MKLPQVGGFLALSGALACLLLLGGGVDGTKGGPDRAQAACGSLKVDPVVISNFPKMFANQYDKKMRIAVARGRQAVSNWRVELYTFGGFLLGKSKFDKSMSRNDHATLNLKLGIQPGKYTLVTKGEVKGCGLIERFDVVSFRDCLSKLPIKFIDKPGGTAADYGGFLSVKIAPNPIFAPLSDIRSTLTNFDGDIFGKAELPRGEDKLIGEQFLDHKLKSGGLKPGGYSVYVTGKARQPRECGNLAASTSLNFK